MEAAALKSKEVKGSHHSRSVLMVESPGCPGCRPCDPGGAAPGRKNHITTRASASSYRTVFVSKTVFDLCYECFCHGNLTELCSTSHDTESELVCLCQTSVCRSKICKCRFVSAILFL